MGVEQNAKYISDLDANAPAGGDSIAQGDDHLRLIKSTIKETFPNVKGQVTASHDQINDLVGGAAASEFASVTYSGSGKVGTAKNIGLIEWKDQGGGWKFAYIPFVTGVDGTSNPNANGGGVQGGNGLLDADLNIQVTAFSSANNSLGLAGFAYGVVTEIDNYHCEIAFTQMDSNGDFQPVWDQAFCLKITKN